MGTVTDCLQSRGGAPLVALLCAALIVDFETKSRHRQLSAIMSAFDPKRTLVRPTPLLLHPNLLGFETKLASS